MRALFFSPSPRRISMRVAGGAPSSYGAPRAFFVRRAQQPPGDEASTLRVRPLPGDGIPTLRMLCGVLVASLALLAGCGDSASSTGSGTTTSAGGATTTSTGGANTGGTAEGGTTSTSNSQTLTGGAGGAGATGGAGGTGGATAGSGGATAGAGGGTTTTTTNSNTNSGPQLGDPCTFGDDCGGTLLYCEAPGCASGTCQPRPPAAGLSPDPDPVCGCDGITYWAADVAASKGQSIAAVGPCPMPIACAPDMACPPGMKCNRLVADGAACSPSALGECWGTALSCPLAGPMARACTTGTCELQCSLIQSENPWYEDPTCL